MPNILLLYNHRSGRQRPQLLLDEIVAVFEGAGERVCIRDIDFGGNPFTDVENFDRVVVAGGDGTIGYVVDRMLRHGLDLPLGIIPAGTANDFATMLGIPHSPREAACRILHGKVCAVDCGRVNGKHFVNILSFGLFTTTSQHTSNIHKRLFGRAAYIAEGLRELRGFRSIPLVVCADDESFEAEVVTTLIFNGCTAGRLPLARTSRADDGALDAVFLLKRPLLRMLFDALLYLCGGHPSSVKHIRSRHLRLTCSSTGITTDTDGEAGPAFPLDVECLAGRLKIVL